MFIFPFSSKIDTNWASLALSNAVSKSSLSSAFNAKPKASSVFVVFNQRDFALSISCCVLLNNLLVYFGYKHKVITEDTTSYLGEIELYKVIEDSVWSPVSSNLI